MALSYLPSGYDSNMAVPEGGFTLGQLLMPNYLLGRDIAQEGGSYRTPDTYLDPDDIEGSFKQQTGHDLRGAIGDLAPGFNVPAGAITRDMLENTRVNPSQQRAPAKDNGFETLLGAGAMAGLGYLSGGFGLGDLLGQFGGFGGDGITSTMASGTNTAGQVAGVNNLPGGNMDWWGTDYMGDFGLPTDVYNPVTANDPIGELIKQLDAGKSSADALKAVESALPGTTRSALEQFLFEAGGNASNMLKSGASKLFGGSDSGDGFSLSKLLGAVGPGIGGYLASNAQADAYRDIANKQLGEGQWARDMLKQSYADPNAYLQGEGKTFLDDAAKRQAYALSTGGNPIGSGNQLTQMMSDAYARNAGALGTYRGGLTSAGYGVPYQAGSQAQLSAAGQQGAGYNALGSIGSGINDIFNPKPTAAMTLADLLKQAGKIT